MIYKILGYNVAMAVTYEFTEGEFGEIFEIARTLLSPVSTNDELAAAIKAENRLFEVLVDVKCRADGVEPPQTFEERLIWLGSSSRSSSPSST